MNPVRLDTTVPFDGAGIMRYLAGHAIPGLEFGDSRHYRRAVRLPDGTTTDLEVYLAGPNAVTATAQLSTRVRQLFDLDADSAAIDAHLATDRALASSVTANPGIRLPGSLDPHEQLFRTMIGQQVSIAAAGTVLGRITRELSDGSGLFPTALQLAEHGREVLRGPAARVTAIHGAAIALASGSLVIDDTLSVAELTDRLVAMPGIGPWTAGYVAMRALGAPDVLLTTDLVLLKGAALLGLPTTPRLLRSYGERWSPFRSYAGLHLWRTAQADTANNQE